VDTVKEGLVERDTEVRLMLLATMCGEHLLLLGPPGTAKSELSRRLAQLSSGYYFERLLTRFSVPEELFGPLSLAGLERDVYERQLHGYLPTVRPSPLTPS
jgi:MoxR-like ATPase